MRASATSGALTVVLAGVLLGGCGQILADLGAAAVWNRAEPPRSGSSLAAVSTGGRLAFAKPVRSWQEIRWQNVVRQELDFSCGSAALATLLQHYHGVNVGEEEIIRHILETGDAQKIKQRQGFSLLDLKKFAQQRGFTAQGFRMDFEALVALESPAIVPVVWRDYNHFVVFRGLAGGRVYLADPAFGNVTMSASRFVGMWKDGVAFLVTNGKQPVDHGLTLRPDGDDRPDLVTRRIGRVGAGMGISTRLQPEF